MCSPSRTRGTVGAKRPRSTPTAITERIQIGRNRSSTPPKRPAGCCEIPSPDDGSTVATSRRRACIGLLTSDLSSIDDCRYKLA